MLIQQPRLAIPLEFLKRNYQLSKDLKREVVRLRAAVDCNRNRSPVRVGPPFVASGCPLEDEAQFTAHRLKVARRGALGIADLGRIRG